MEVGRLQYRMRRGRWRGLPRAVVGTTLKPRAMQTVVSGRARVQEHHVLRERVVQPLQHGVHQNEDDELGCGCQAGYCSSSVLEARMMFHLTYNVPDMQLAIYLIANHIVTAMSSSRGFASFIRV